MRPPKTSGKDLASPPPKWNTRARGTAGSRDRQATIHTLLYQEWKNPPRDGRYQNSATLSKLLCVAPSTIDRDIAEMRDRRGLPIETLRGGRGGHRYTEEVVDFPGVQFSEGELYFVVLGIGALSAQYGTASEMATREVVEKLFSTLDQRMVTTLKRLESLITFRSGGYEARVDLRLLEQIIRALLDQEELTFRHTKPEPDAEPQMRHVQPRHLAAIAGNWYLFADDLDHQGKPRHFALTRITELQSTGIRFTPRESFDLEERLNNSLGVHTGGSQQEVRLRFERKVRTFVLERDWHRSQTIRQLEDGSVEVRFTAPVNEELQRFVFQWGADVEVVEPLELRAAVVAELRRAAAAYGG